MKKSFLTLMIVAASMMAACSQKSSDADFIVTGRIENVEDGMGPLWTLVNICGRPFRKQGLLWVNIFRNSN